jgi:hypothetical protein
MAELLRPDLTRVFDPAVLWPDPDACPNWPGDHPELGRPSRGYGTIQDAEAALEILFRNVNQTGSVREPTNEDAAWCRNEYFQSGNAIDFRWPSLGFGDLRPRPGHGSIPELIVEATHIRGYIRKLEAKAKKQADADERYRLSSLQHKIDHYKQSEPRLLRELRELEKAERRYFQRVDDEKAAVRCANIRSHLEGAHRDAVSAASTLGVDPPIAPTLRKSR